MAPIKTVVGKNSNCVPEGRFGCFVCSMWSYVSTWRATVDDGRVNNADVFPMRYRRQKGFISSDRGGGDLSMHGVCNRLRGMQALLVGVSFFKPPCPILPR